MLVTHTIMWKFARHSVDARGCTQPSTAGSPVASSLIKEIFSRSRLTVPFRAPHIDVSLKLRDRKSSCGATARRLAWLRSENASMQHVSP